MELPLPDLANMLKSDVEAEMKNFAKRLRDARIEARLTQEQAAGRAGIHPITWCRYETQGTPPVVQSFRKIAKAVGVPVSHLFGEDA